MSSTSFAVTAGHGCEELCASFDAAHDDYSSILVKAIADRFAEAAAEWLHARVRREWGYGRDESLSAEDLIEEKYRGIRPAPGYPACPDHTEKRLLLDLLEAEARAGITLTSSMAMLPGASVSGTWLWHPDARYFGIGRIGRENSAVLVRTGRQRQWRLWYDKGFLRTVFEDLIMSSMNSFGSRKALQVGGRSVQIYSLPALQAAGFSAIARLPFSLKILLENLLRHEDGRFVKVTGEGHTGYQQSDCAQAIVDAYLVDLQPPSNDTECD